MPLYQNEVKCSTFDMEMIFHSHAIKSHFHKKGRALGLILIARVFGTRKWPVAGPVGKNVNFQVLFVLVVTERYLNDKVVCVCVWVCFFVIIIKFYFFCDCYLLLLFFSINTSSSVTDRYHVPSSIPQSLPAVQRGPTVMSQYPTHEKHVFSVFGGSEPRIPPRKNEDR